MAARPSQHRVLNGTGPLRTLRVSAYSNDFVPLSGSGTLFELQIGRVSTNGLKGSELTFESDHLAMLSKGQQVKAPIAQRLRGETPLTHGMDLRLAQHGEGQLHSKPANYFQK